MELNSKQKKRRILLEIKDILLGAAFPLMLQLILSTTIILFADYSGDAAVQGLALAVGEAMLIGAYVIFGRQNGLSAYRKKALADKKRALEGKGEISGLRELDDKEAEFCFKTGEYAVWKSFVIGFISVVPFILVQFIQCLAPNTVCEFLLKYAFGWAAYPFLVFGVETQWLNFIWLIIPVGVHSAAYCFAGYKESKRQKILQQAQSIKGKKK